MLRSGILICLLASVAAAQNPTVTVSSATGVATLAPASLAMAKSSDVILSIETLSATNTPWPATLGGATIRVTDSLSITRQAGLLYVSPGQINFEIPEGTALGNATVAIQTGTEPTLIPSRLITVPVQIVAVAPGIFAMNTAGVAAAYGIRTVIPTGIQSTVPVFQCPDGIADNCTLVPIDPGVDAPVTLVFFGTGIQGRSSLSNVVVTLGTAQSGATYAGPVPVLPGLDQVNVPVPLSLRGSGVINVTFTVDGVTSNPVKISVQ